MVDFKDLLDRITRMVKMRNAPIDLDFFVFPQRSEGVVPPHPDDASKGYKISIHYEPEMEEPDVKIERGYDEDEIKEHLGKDAIDLSKLLEKLPKKKPQNHVLDAEDLSLQPQEQAIPEPKVKKPHAEVHEKAHSLEIIAEMPGIQLDDIILSFEERGKKLVMSGKTKHRYYIRGFDLPFQSCVDETKLRVKNGIVCLTIREMEPNSLTQ